MGSTLVELLTATGNGAGQTLEVLLQVRKDLLCVVLGSITRLALVLLGTIADVVGLLLRKADDLLLTGNGEGLLLSVGDDGISLSGGGSPKVPPLP